MMKIYSDGKITEAVSELLPRLLEQVIDARFKYLKELDYENQCYANKILKEEYQPAVDALKKVIQTIGN